MAEEDFEIDVYGDADNENTENAEPKRDDSKPGAAEAEVKQTMDGESRSQREESGREDTVDADLGGSDMRPPHGTKRKEGADDRPLDPGATSAIMISDMNWWITDDDIRGWASQAACEDELRDITFSEHKVNGKSKGQAYVEFSSQQAATAMKHRLHALANENSTPGASKKYQVMYASPSNNPFRTLPKDAPARVAKDGQNRTPAGPGYNTGNNFNSGGGNNYGGGFRGGRGGFNGQRGGAGGGMNPAFNRNFSTNNMNAFNNNTSMGFSNPMGGGNFGGGFNRGGGNFVGGMRGGANMRGGRGGMNPAMNPGMNPAMAGMNPGMTPGMNPGMNAGMMGGMPMGGMPMGGMPGAMGAMGGMGMMGGGMPGFQGMPNQFNPGFFGGGPAVGGGGNQSNDWQNPHGVKRARGE